MSVGSVKPPEKLLEPTLVVVDTDDSGLITVTVTVTTGRVVTGTVVVW